MFRVQKLQRVVSFADLFILFVLAALIYGAMGFAQQWQGQFQSVVDIDLSTNSLPKYAFFSACRGLAAYVLSLAFTFFYGYAAAKSPTWEKILIPLLDVLQTIPVLGFLPGLVLGAIALFPNSNIGLELATIIMIFTSQAWNLTFSFYGSIRTMPRDLQEMSNMVGLTWKQRLKHLELPSSAMGLAWNSLLSMAGGWFFLTICESYTLGSRTFRLPGLGSYMAVAIEQNNVRAMILGVVAMTIVILIMDFMMWRPLLVWVRRFRFDSMDVGIDGGFEPNESLMLKFFEESRILSRLKSLYKKIRSPKGRRKKIRILELFGSGHKSSKRGKKQPHLLQSLWHWNDATKQRWLPVLMWMGRATLLILGALGTWYLLWGVVALMKLLSQLSGKFWILLLRDTGWTCLRVLGAFILSTLWTVPVAVAIGLSERATRICQPLIQVAAAFPAPMIYPIVLALLFRFNIDLRFGATILVMTGVQWYMLFNVLGGANSISKDLRASMVLCDVPTRRRWLRLYLPGIFPSLVLGWIVAMGSAWNACIVTEYIKYNNKVVTTNGIGATMSLAAEQGNFAALAATLVVIILIVILIDRLVWYRLSKLADTKYKFEGA